MVELCKGSSEIERDKSLINDVLFMIIFIKKKLLNECNEEKSTMSVFSLLK